MPPLDVDALPLTSGPIRPPLAPVRPSADIVGEVDQHLGNARAAMSPEAGQAFDLAHAQMGSPLAAEPTPTIAPMLGESRGLPVTAPAEKFFGAPKPTMASAAPPAPRPLSANRQELARVESSPSGIGKLPMLARIPLSILDAIGQGVRPLQGIERALPGTAGHHQQILEQDREAVKAEDTSNEAAARQALQEAQTGAIPSEIDLREAQAAEQRSLPELHNTQEELKREHEAELQAGAASKAELERTKAENKKQSDADKLEYEKGRDKLKHEFELRSKGYTLDENGHERPLRPDELSEAERARLEQQHAVADLQGARKSLIEAQTKYNEARAAGVPAQIEIARERLASANTAHDLAERRLGLSERQFENRTEGPTTTQRDAAGRADTMLDLDKRIRAALNNPEIANGTGPLAGRLSEIQNRLGTLPHDLAELKNDLISYGAFQAGLHPVRGIGALEYFDKVMGGLGQNPEELIGKLDSNVKTAESVKKVGAPLSQRVDPQVKAYADKYFGGDVTKAQEAIKKQGAK